MFLLLFSWPFSCPIMADILSANFTANAELQSGYSICKPLYMRLTQFEHSDLNCLAHKAKPQ